DAGGNTWTGTGTLTSNGGNGAVATTRDADFTLANSSLAATDGLSMNLVGIGTANLTGITHAHTFTLNSAADKWTGTGALTSNGGSGAVATTRDADFTLANGSLAASDGMAMTLAGIGTANLTAITHGHTFTLNAATDKWTGRGTLTNVSANGTVVTTRDADFT